MSHYEERAFMNEEMARDIDDPLQDAERKIARLSAELTEARKIIAALIEGSEEDDNELLEALAPHIGTEPGNIDITDSATRRARAFLKGETDNG